MRITEIFASIQGESTHAGRPCTFVRTTGCDQRCTWCDTAYAFHGGTELDVDEICAQVAAHGIGLVEVTGGEPLMQADTPALLTRLCDLGHDVLLETGGSLPIEGIDPRVGRIVDVKCPASGMSGRIRWANLEALRDGDEVKFVVADRNDYDWTCEVMHAHGLAEKVPVLVAPVHGRIDPAELAAWMVADGLPARLQMQIHKVIWAPEARGV